jgi:hypothetical protein
MLFESSLYELTGLMFLCNKWKCCVLDHMTIILKFCISSWDDVHFIVTVIILVAQCFLWLPNTWVANCQDRESSLTLPDEFVITSIGLLIRNARIDFKPWRLCMMELF